MKLFTFSGALLMVLALSSCGKNNSPGGGTANPTVLRPATMKSYDGTIGTLAPVCTYEYDKDNLLIKFGEESTNFRNVSPRRSQLKLFYQDVEATTNYEFGYATDRSSIYELQNQPTVVSVQTSIYNKTFNQTTKPDVYEWRFTYNADFLVVKDVTPLGTGTTVDYTYDDKKNLTKIAFSSIVAGLWRVHTRTTITGYDDKHSPFSAVKAYRLASFPQNYNDQFAQAFCIHNPTQMKSERYSTTRNIYYLAEQTDFDYTYNAQGYPTKIVVKTTYFPETGPGGSGMKIYEFTYK